MVAVRFLLDEDVVPDLAAALRARGLNAVTVDEIRATAFDGRRRVTDAEVCAEVAREPTVLITLNVRDYADRAFQEDNVVRHSIAVVMVRVPKAESAALRAPMAIRDIVHRFAHRADALHRRAPVVATANRAGLRIYELR